MPQFKFDNLPKGYEFPITRREIREFVKTTSANFELIEFHGISSTENSSTGLITGLRFVGYLNAEFRDEEWVFRLRIDGLRPERFENRREEISRSLLAEIRRWVEGKLGQLKTEPKKPCRAIVYFDLSKDASELVTVSEWSN